MLCDGFLAATATPSAGSATATATPSAGSGALTNPVSRRYDSTHLFYICTCFRCCCSPIFFLHLHLQQVLVLCNPVSRFWCSATPSARNPVSRFWCSDQPCLSQVLTPRTCFSQVHPFFYICTFSRFWCSATPSAGSGDLTNQPRLSQVLTPRTPRCVFYICTRYLTPRTCFTFAPYLFYAPVSGAAAAAAAAAVGDVFSQTPHSFFSTYQPHSCPHRTFLST